MLPDEDEKKKIDDFLKRVREAAGANLESVVLYGSAASGNFHPGHSNLNLFCVLRDSSFPSLKALAPVAKWCARQKQPAPLCMTREELERSADVFPIECMDMQQHHRILFGTDVLKDLQIPTHRHRIQVEYELREKTILLRQQVMLAAETNSRLWDLLLHSLPSFATLFRHALIVLGSPAAASTREAVQALSERVGFDPSAINQILDIREHKSETKKVDIQTLFERYLATIAKVTDAVDKELDSVASGRP